MQKNQFMRMLLILFLFLSLAACGGGGGGGGSDAADDIDSNSDTNNDDSVVAGTGTEIDMWAGGVASSVDGVTVEALEGSWSGIVEVVFEETETTNAPVEDGFAASDVYVIRLLGFETGETTVPFKVTVPVTTTDLPTPIDEYAFAIETYNEGTKQWDRNDAMAQYDENSNMVTFWANHFSKKRVVYIGYDPNVELQKYLYKSDNDKFYITYFSPVTFNKPSSHLPPADNEWQGSGTAVSSEVPNYIEDLGKALETALAYHTTKIIKPDGYLLFDDPTHDVVSLPDHAISVTVKKIPAKGDTRLGGPMRIDTGLKNWHEMKIVAAHELVHLLGDQYYTGTGARTNRWFYEAIAEFYGTRAAGYTHAERTTYFSNYYNYLKVSLDASDETSYYAIGDFLYWLEDKMNYHVAAGVIISDYAWDISGLNNLLKDLGSSLGEEYSQYVLACTVGDHDLRALNIKSSINFSSSTLYKKYRFKQPHLTARHVRVNPYMTADGMLVAESGVHYQYGGGIPLKTYSYTDESIPVADIDNNLEKTIEANKPIVVKHFGKKGTDGVQYSVFHQIIINPLMADMTVGGGEYYFDYYILVPPEIKSSSAGKVTWSLPNYGEDTIKGFHVYSDGVQLTGNPITSWAYSDARILSNSDVLVTVVDKFDNEWPEDSTAKKSLLPLLYQQEKIFCDVHVVSHFTNGRDYDRFEFSMGDLEWNGTQVTARVEDQWNEGPENATNKEVTATVSSDGSMLTRLSYKKTALQDDRDDNGDGYHNLMTTEIILQNVPLYNHHEWSNRVEYREVRGGDPASKIVSLNHSWDNYSSPELSFDYTYSDWTEDSFISVTFADY